MVVEHLVAVAQGAGHSDYRDALFLGNPRDADGRLAACRLGVQRPFAGNHEVSACHPLCKMARLGQQFHPRRQPAADKRDEPGAKAPRRAATGLLPFPDERLLDAILAAALADFETINRNAFHLGRAALVKEVETS